MRFQWNRGLRCRYSPCQQASRCCCCEIGVDLHGGTNCYRSSTATKKETIKQMHRRRRPSFLVRRAFNSALAPGSGTLHSLTGFDAEESFSCDLYCMRYSSCLLYDGALSSVTS